jgi:hypothetical protein
MRDPRHQAATWYPRRLTRRAPCRAPHSAHLAVRSAYGWWRRALGTLERVPPQRSMDRTQAVAEGQDGVRRVF